MVFYVYNFSINEKAFHAFKKAESYKNPSIKFLSIWPRACCSRLYSKP